MGKLTDEQKKKYLENPGLCPWCGSSQIQGIDGALCWQEVECLKCKAHWIDLYRLYDVEEVLDD